MTQSNSDGVVLALDFGGTKIAAAIAEADGAAIIVHDSCPTHAAQGARQALERGISLARQLSDGSATQGRPVAAIGVATMGITEESRVRLAPTVPGWSDLQIPATLATVFPSQPLVIENDVRAATIAELRWGALANVADGIYVNFGSGVGAGVVAAGQLVHGAHGAAGEIGYLLRSAADLERGTEEELPAPFEAAVSGHAVRRRALREFGEPLDFQDLAQAPPSLPRARELYDRIVEEICFQIANLAIALDPEVIVVGGGYARTPTHIVPALRDALERVLPTPPRVTPAHFGGDSALRGALALAGDLLRCPQHHSTPTPVDRTLSTRERGAST